MVESLLRHCTDAEIQKNYVDTHGQSELAFAFCHLLSFRLLPRLKDIASQKPYRPEAGNPSDYENLQSILTRPIDWDLIFKTAWRTIQSFEMMNIRRQGHLQGMEKGEVRGQVALSANLVWSSCLKSLREPLMLHSFSSYFLQHNQETQRIR